MLNVDRITKSFDNHKVLNGVSFSIDDGEIYGLIGKNGAGKTTLLRIASGLLRPTLGEAVFVDGGRRCPIQRDAVSVLGGLLPFPILFIPP